MGNNSRLLTAALEWDGKVETFKLTGRDESPRFIGGTGSWNGSETGREISRKQSREIGREHRRETRREHSRKNGGVPTQSGNRSGT